MVISFVSRVNGHLAVKSDGKAMTIITPPTQLFHFVALPGGERIGHAQILQLMKRAINSQSFIFLIISQTLESEGCGVWDIDSPKIPLHAAAVLRDRLYKSIGGRIAAARDGKLTQLELARRVGMSRPAIANIERGEQQIYVHQLISVADALGLSISDLLPQGQFRPVERANVSVSGDKINRAQERVIKELVSAITSTTRKVNLP